MNSKNFPPISLSEARADRIALRKTVERSRELRLEAQAVRLHSERLRLSIAKNLHEFQTAQESNPNKLNQVKLVSTGKSR